MPEDANMEKVRKIDIPEAMIHHSDKKQASVVKTRTKLLNNRVLGMVKHGEKARKLLSILRKNKVSMNALGNVFYQDEILPDTHLEELFCDVINGTKKILPKNYELFYNILIYKTLYL